LEEQLSIFLSFASKIIFVETVYKTWWFGCCF